MVASFGGWVLGGGPQTSGRAIAQTPAYRPARDCSGCLRLTRAGADACVSKARTRLCLLRGGRALRGVCYLAASLVLWVDAGEVSCFPSVALVLCRPPLWRVALPGARPGAQVFVLRLCIHSIYYFRSNVKL